MACCPRAQGVWLAPKIGDGSQACPGGYLKTPCSKSVVLLFWARGKRRGFSPVAATCHLQYARVHVFAPLEVSQSAGARGGGGL